VHRVFGGGQLVGDGALDAGDRRAGVGFVEGGGVVEEVDDPAETRLGPDGELDRGDAGAEGLADVGQGAVEVGALAVELVDDDHPGQAQGGGGSPGVLGLGLYAVDGADDDDGHVGQGQGHLHVGAEVGVAGGVEEVDFHPVDGDRRQGQGHRQLPRGLLRLEVADRGAAVDRSLPGDGAGGGHQGLGQRGLAGSVVADQGHVADVRR